ncbi:pentatricopeptide repeat-containing protein At2g33760 [Coffea eugenioides]|uniref:pentatricopeptide repeat-containing protein At2g33760 n=1 Tax=Coffea eugenioides TaxID=49369 RepID=UPI000F615A06|nr:pentatricopeptide repeat-containing protein At2g33760 [Coffea eugenioides]
MNEKLSQQPDTFVFNGNRTLAQTSPYQILLRAGSHLKLLKQVHAHIITTGRNHHLPLLTKLATSAISSGAILYAQKLFLCAPTVDGFLLSSLITAASKSHFPLQTILFYRHMLARNISPTNYTYTSVIKACAQLQDPRTGRVVHCHVLTNGFSLDQFVQAALVSFYSKIRELKFARKMFDEMPQKSIVSWNSMISGYEQNGFADEAIMLFAKMRELGVQFDSATLVSVLSACADTGALELGSWVHDYVKSSPISLDVVLGTALINMYAKCGNVRKARGVFDLMDEPNVMAWTAMISGYGMHGFGKEAIDLFRLMINQGIYPNEITFVAVLSACAHAGLVQEGREAFAIMKNYGMMPGTEHHVCMVDMFGRMGLLSEAYHYIKDLFPFQPAPAVWTAMLGACKLHKNYDLGVEVADNLFAAEPDNAGHYVLLSNMYALAGQMERVEMVRNAMISKELKKPVGYSIIEIDQKAHLFSTGGMPHPESMAILQFLDELVQQIKAAGYVPVSEAIMHELEEEEKECALRYHSEKFAVAFGLLKTRQGVPIRIVKNLRICEDCHMAIKYISLVSKREICVRDKLRFHHFKDGSCSCKDFW